MELRQARGRLAGGHQCPAPYDFPLRETQRKAQLLGERNSGLCVLACLPDFAAGRVEEGRPSDHARKAGRVLELPSNSQRSSASRQRLVGVTEQPQGLGSPARGRQRGFQIHSVANRERAVLPWIVMSQRALKMATCQEQLATKLCRASQHVAGGRGERAGIADALASADHCSAKSCAAWNSALTKRAPPKPKEHG
jgi:hypothetical protein